MTENLKQRRGKKNSNPPPISASSAEIITIHPPTTPIEQLRTALERLIVSLDRTADLHVAWRGQLFRLSLIVVFVALYQLQNSIAACIHEIKDHDSTALNIHGAEAMKLIFTDSFSEVLGVIISSLLAYFLAVSTTNADRADLNAWPYMLSSALTPLCLGFFFHSKSSMRCLGEKDATELIANSYSVDEKRHQFPAVIIYHTIVTIAFWFMKSGLQECEENVRVCSQTINDLERLQRKSRK